MENTLAKENTGGCGPSQLFAWSTDDSNKISIIDLETKQEYAQFDGVRVNNLSEDFTNWTHLKEIPNTSLLVSLQYSWCFSANMWIFDISKKGKVRKVYAFEEFQMVEGHGDVTYNSCRSLLAAPSAGGKIAYNLFKIDPSTPGNVAKLYRKSEWPTQCLKTDGNCIAGLDFDPMGESMAMIDRYGMCVITNVNTNGYRSHWKFTMSYEEDDYGRCRWTTNIGEPFLFIKYDQKDLGILDIEKKTFIQKTAMNHLEMPAIYWIDVCPSDGNLVATGDEQGTIKIYDKRGKTQNTKTFHKVHRHQVYCVRWHSTGSVVASCSTESTAKIIDFKTGKVLENVKSRHRGKFFEISVLIDLDVEGLPSVCFLQPNA